MTDFIAYMTTIGGKIDLTAADAMAAVRSAVEQEAAAGHPGAQVIALSYRHPDDGSFRAASDQLLASIPGTTAYGPDPYFPCPCGRSHRLSAEVGDLIRTLGAAVAVTTPDGRWQVPRIWIAVHGLKPHELPALAKAHKWRQVPG